MIIQRVKTAVIEACQAVFDDAYPVEQMRNITVGRDYAVISQSLPAIWTDFTLRGPVQTVGLDHREYVLNDDSYSSKVTGRWSFAGDISLTAIAEASGGERDLMVDELIKVALTGKFSPSRGRFRSAIEDHDLIRMTANWDQVNVGGLATNPRSPWQDDTYIHEGTLTITIVGEAIVIVDEAGDSSFLPLSAIKVWPRADGTPLDWSGDPDLVVE